VLPAPDEESLRDEGSLRQFCHDIGTPALAIRLLADLVAGDERLSTETQQHLRAIQREAEFITDMCGRPLGRTPSRRARLHVVARDISDQAELVHGCSMVTTLEPVVLFVEPVVARRLVSNLVDNACRASGPGGTVSITVRNFRTYAIVEVADTGPGPGRWAELLTPGAPRRPTRGLGLPIVRSLVEQCSGSVVVERSSVLKGANVVVTLPLGRLPTRMPLASGSEASS
jgi:signal transduction histidine kinase